MEALSCGRKTFCNDVSFDSALCDHTVQPYEGERQGCSERESDGWICEFRDGEIISSEASTKKTVQDWAMSRWSRNILYHGCNKKFKG